MRHDALPKITKYGKELCHSRRRASATSRKGKVMTWGESGIENGSSEAAARAPSPFEAPQISLPKGGGAIRGIDEKFTANPATGTGAISIPLALSAGRGGFGPQLALYGWMLRQPRSTASETAMLQIGPKCLRSRSRRDTALALLEQAGLAVRQQGIWTAVIPEAKP